MKWILISIILISSNLEAQHRNRFVKSTQADLSQEVTKDVSGVDEIDELRKAIADLQRQINSKPTNVADTYEKLLKETKDRALQPCKKAGGKTVSVTITQDQKLNITCNEMK